MNVILQSYFVSRRKKFLLFSRQNISQFLLVFAYYVIFGQKVKGEVVPMLSFNWAPPPPLPQYVFMAWCLIKNRDNFTFTSPLHEDVMGEWGIAPRILDLGTRWRWVVSFTPRPLYLPGKNPLYPLDRRLGGPHSRSGRGGEEKNSQPPPGIEPENPNRPARSPALYRLSYHGSTKYIMAREIYSTIKNNPKIIIN
jgi:hypothetical protein